MPMLLLQANTTSPAARRLGEDPEAEQLQAQASRLSEIRRLHGITSFIDPPPSIAAAAHGRKLCGGSAHRGGRRLSEEFTIIPSGVSGTYCCPTWYDKVHDSSCALGFFCTRSGHCGNCYGDGST